MIELKDALATVIGGKDAIQTAERMLGTATTVQMLARMQEFELQFAYGLSPARAKQVKAALELGKHLFTPVNNRVQIKSPEDAFHAMAAWFVGLAHEEVRALILNTRNHVIGSYLITSGTVNSASMRMSEVFTEAVRVNATSIVIAHNHPSGDPAPSAEDITVTKNIVNAAKLLDIEVLDHIVIGQGRYVSMKERGLM